MYIGNRAQLDAARETLRDQFDAVWLASPVMGERESRAARCAMALDRPRSFHLSPNRRIFKGGWSVGGKAGDALLA